MNTTPNSRLVWMVAATRDSNVSRSRSALIWLIARRISWSLLARRRFSSSWSKYSLLSRPLVSSSSVTWPRNWAGSSLWVWPPPAFLSWLSSRRVRSRSDLSLSSIGEGPVLPARLPMPPPLALEQPEQGLDHRRIELGPRLAAKLRDRLVHRVGWAMRSARGHALEGVHHRQDASSNGDLALAQAARIPAAVPALVVGQHHVTHRSLIEWPDHLGAGLGMLHERMTLVGAERPQDRRQSLVDGAHPQVVNRRHVGDLRALGGGHAQLARQGPRHAHRAARPEQPFALEPRDAADRLGRFLDGAPTVRMGVRARDRAAHPLDQRGEEGEVVLVALLARRLVVDVDDAQDLAFDAERNRQQRLGAVLGVVDALKATIGLDVVDQHGAAPRRHRAGHARAHQGAAQRRVLSLEAARSRDEQVATIRVDEHEGYDL